MAQDIMRRILRDFFGYEVNFVMNITDVDDKVSVPRLPCSRAYCLFYHYDCAPLCRLSSGAGNPISSSATPPNARLRRTAPPRPA